MDYELSEICGIFQDDCRSPELVSDLFSAWLGRMRAELDRELVALGNDERVGVFRQIYSELDAIGKMRFLAAPDVSEFLEEPSASAYVGENKGAVTVFEAMFAALRRERLIAQVRANCASPPLPGDSMRIASPLGDVVAIYSSDLSTWSLEETPKVADVVAVDFDSPLSLRYEPESGTFSQPRLALTGTEKAAALAKLERALSLIDEATPTFGLMIRTFTRRIVVRKTHGVIDTEANDHLPLASEFRPVHSACIRLLNVHRQEMDVVLCMEALVHETVHSYISCYEEIRGKITSTRVAVRPMSPWSGNMIPNHSLAHAVFVYYALCRLYRGLLQLNASFDEQERVQIRRRYADVQAGFLVDRPLSSLFFLDNPPSPGLYQIIDSLQASVKRSLDQAVYEDGLVEEIA